MKHLSRFDIEAIADKYVQAYMALPDVRNTQIYRIDPELLLEKVLGLNVEYQHLSYDGILRGGKTLSAEQNLCDGHFERDAGFVFRRRQVF